MPKSKQQKEQMVAEVASQFKVAKSTIMANVGGLTVADSQALRRLLRDNGVGFLAVKKTLLRVALKQSGMDNVDVKAMSGSLGVAFSPDEVTAAKLLKDFAKKHEQVAFAGGILEGQVISVEDVKKLSNMPSKQELLAKLVGSLNSPISGFVNVLAGNLRGFCTVLNAIKESKS